MSTAADVDPAATPMTAPAAELEVYCTCLSVCDEPPHMQLHGGRERAVCVQMRGCSNHVCDRLDVTQRCGSNVTASCSRSLTQGEMGLRDQCD